MSTESGNEHAPAMENRPEQSASRDDAAPPERQPTEAKKKPRSVVERVVVWGVIAVLGGVTLLEYRSRSAFMADYQGVLDAIEESDAGNKNVTEGQVKETVTRYSKYETQENLEPNDLAANRVDTYTYRGSLKGPRVLYIYYGIPEPGEATEVIKATTEEAQPVPKTYLGGPPPDVEAGQGQQP